MEKKRGGALAGRMLAIEVAFMECFDAKSWGPSLEACGAATMRWCWSRANPLLACASDGVLSIGVGVDGRSPPGVEGLRLPTACVVDGESPRWHLVEASGMAEIRLLLRLQSS